jgi:hypothetical protein
LWRVAVVLVSMKDRQQRARDSCPTLLFHRSAIIASRSETSRHKPAAERRLNGTFTRDSAVPGHARGMMRTLTFVGIIAAATAAYAQQKPAGSLTDVSGVWIMLIEGHQVGLELDQKGTTIEGVMQIMGQRQLLKGTYEDRTLTLKGEKPEDGSAPPHNDPSAGPITARMLDDGTLEGELSTNRGRRPWTGERLRKQ